jgi:sugar (pentulose or hexulose) kinase
MTESLRCVRPDSIVTGWDFSTGGVKCLAFDLTGRTVAEIRLTTDLWRGEHDENGLLLQPGVYELNLMQLEGQARASMRAIVEELRKRKRLADWVVGGISATHHTAGRIDKNHNQVRRAICWNDQTLAAFRRRGERRLGGKSRVQELIGGPWADRYSLSHLVKDEAEENLSAELWKQTYRILPHGPLAAGHLTGNFDVTSVSAAASTGMMDLRSCRWCPGMLDALASPKYRRLAKKQLPRIIEQSEPIGPLSAQLAAEVGIDPKHAPLVFPTSDDQAAGLVGGGAVEDGQLAIILGNSAVVNSSSAGRPLRGQLDVMRLNWGPYLWMRCYNNGAQFVDHVVPPQPSWKKADWERLEKEARNCSPGCGGTAVMPFLNPEPSLGVSRADTRWFPSKPTSRGIRRRASLESLAYLIALGVRAHEAAGQKITQITVSGGISRSDLMCEILASVLNRPLKRLVSDEGPALGAAVTALAAMETHLRRKKRIKQEFTVTDAVEKLVKFRRGTVSPNPNWQPTYEIELKTFEKRVRQSKGN